MKTLQKIEIGEHNLRDVPKNTSGLIVNTFKEPAYNINHRFCGYHYYYKVNISGVIYSVPEWATNKRIKD